MINFFGKKKIGHNQVANIFVNGLLESVEKGWPIIVDFIKDSPEVVKSPDLDTEDYGKFLMIVVAVNYHYIPDHFEKDIAREIIQLSVQKFATVFGVEPTVFAQKVKDTKSFLNKVNGSSKKLINSMGKGIVHKYNLVDCQDDFFIKLKSENPIFVKNLDEILFNYIWDWEAFKEKYKVKESSSKQIF